ncbi:venom phosphodiesterase 2-like [Tubulanus polymorphus]|uniref:venom phosphodiesterase 2-like n=1 Tax=Tubulanus polymorphus TaxID=672921 RepID=UPI003DA5E51D
MDGEAGSKNILMMSTDDEVYLTGSRRQFLNTLRQERCRSIAVVSSVILVLIFLAIGVYFSVIYHGSQHKEEEWINSKCPTPGKAVCPKSFSVPPVILVSLDGFRADFLLRKMTPVLDRLRQCGSHVPYVRASYPTKTFVNHYTLATGLFPESNGIIDNNMYDQNMNYPFISSIPQTFQDPRWWLGDPIWNTVTKQNKISATYYWPGSDVRVEGMYPHYYRKYNKSVPFESRVQQVLKWLDLPDGKRPDFITLYFDEPDSAEHRTGIDSKLVNDKLKEVDRMVGLLMQGLFTRNLHNCVNIIVLADHGMSNTPCKNIVSLDKYINLTGIFVFEGSVGRINNDHEYIDGKVVPSKNPQPVEKLLSELRCKNEHLDVYRKEDLPKRLHYSNSRRIEELVLNSEDGWQFYMRNGTCGGGSHGFDNIYASMHALFIAHGPYIKQNTQSKSFLNIELYQLLTDLLQINPAPNNGTAGALHHLLVNPPKLQDRPVGRQYVKSSYPGSSTEYDKRASSMADCYCPNQNVSQLDERLNITDNNTQEYKKQHIPFGEPILLIDDTVSLLIQAKYITAYSEELHSAVWTSFTMSGTSQSLPVINSSLPCLRPDVRSPIFNQTATCQNFLDSKSNYSASPLYQPGIDGQAKDNMNAYILSNMVPMLPGFHLDVWSKLLSLVSKWQRMSKNLNIVMGPVYDYNADGLRDKKSEIKRYMGDIPVASHFFLVVTKCSKEGSEICEKYDASAFILPHKSKPVVCKEFKEYLLLNSARVRDVELLTGLLFYPKLPRYNTIRLQTFLLDSLWPVS